MKIVNRHMFSIMLFMFVPILLLSCTGSPTTVESSDSNISAIKAPSQPLNVKSNAKDSSVVLTWDPPAGATSYNLYWNTAGGVTSTSSKILNVSMPFDHTSLTNNTTYYYRVTALNMWGESVLSEEVRGTPLLPFTKILTKLMDPDAENSDEFGWSVGIDGEYAVVGAWRSASLDPVSPLHDAGAAYVFHKTAGIWNPSGTKLMAPDAQVGDRFGCAVSISGDYVIIGAMREDGGPGDPMESAGAVYIFHRTAGNTWDAGVKIGSPDQNAFGLFGSAVSISGDYAIVGHERESRAYVFHRTGTNAWDSGAMLWTYDTEADDYFGRSVAISGDYAIVGAYGEDGGAANLLNDAGAAYIFHRTGVNSWDQVSKIMPHDGNAGDNFGYSVAISGDYAAVGANHKDNGTGAAYVFHRLDENFWDEGPKIFAPDAQEGDLFGWSIGITDKYVIVGAYLEDCGWDTNDGEGAAYVYERIGTNTWDGGTKITIPQGDEGDNFGFSVAISGESTIIGAIGDDCEEVQEVPSAGAAYLY